MNARTIGVIVLTGVLAFPPSIFADNITWQGGDATDPNSFSTADNWTCATCSSSVFPNNGSLGLSFEASITQAGADVILDAPVTVNSLSLGGSGTATLEANSGVGITLGTPSFSGNALAVSIGGVLNINSGGSVAIDFSGGAGALNDTGGQINVTDGGTLTLQNSLTSSGTLTDNGTIGVMGSGSAATLMLDDTLNPGSTFNINGGGTLTLGGFGQIAGTQGDEILVNGSGHTITGDGAISNLSLTNNGIITASTSAGILTLDVSNTGALTNSGSLNVSDGSTLTIQNLSGANTTITNTGTINLNASSNATTLVLNDGGTGSAFTLSGSGGKLIMSDNANNLITSGTGGESLINDTGHTIQGSGTISNFASITNNGSLVSDGAAGLTLDLTGVSPLTGNPDTFTNNGTVSVRNGSALTIASSGGTSIDNEGTIYLGTHSTSGSLVLSDTQKGATDVLTTSGFGELKMSDNAANSISGGNGMTLVNDTFHTIVGAGTISVANFTNNGTLQSKYADNALIVSGNLTNWDGTSNTLTGGTYIAGHGSTMQLSSIGSSEIQNISGANIAIYGSSMITGDGINSAITGANGVNSIYSGTTGTGNLLLGWVPGTVTLGTNSSGVFNVSADDNNVNYSPGSFPPAGGEASLELSGTTALINGDLMNAATTSNFLGFAASGVLLDHNSTLTVNNLTNLAATSGNYDTALAAVQLTQGSTLNVNGSVINASIPSIGFSVEDPEASISLDGKSVLNVNSGAFTNTASFLYLTNNSTANVAGLFTNDVNSAVSLDLATGYTTPSGSILNANGGFMNSGEIDLNNVSALNNTGAFNNTGLIYLEGSALTTFDSKTASGSFVNDGSLGYPNGFVSVDAGSTLTVSGTFSNINGAGLNITNNSTASVTGLFTNGCLSSVVLDGSTEGQGGGTPGASLTTHNGFSNAGLVSLNVSSALTNSGLFRNTGLITVDNASVLTNTGTFRNSGTVYTGATGGGNMINVTGAVFNTSAGMINLTGNSDSMTVTGHFINSGAVSLSGDSASFSSDGLANKSGATIVLSADSNTASSTSWASNKGTILFSGSNGQVSSVGDFTNTSAGVITMQGSKDTLFTYGSANIYNAGTVTIGDSESVIAGGNYTQTAGTTTVAAGGNLGAGGIVDLQGGLLTGGGTVTGELLVEGGTLSPGDPESFSVLGSYVETSGGILDLDFAGFGDPDLGDYDQIDVTGTVSLGGTLDLTLEPGFDAALGTEFDIINWTVGDTPGDFNTFNDVSFDGNRTFAEVFNANGTELDLEVVATPEPSTLSMLFCAMMVGAGIAWRVRRRAQGAR